MLTIVLTNMMTDWSNSNFFFFTKVESLKEFTNSGVDENSFTFFFYVFLHPKTELL